jgi:pantetheine-phosphate adenylyltransferase
MIAFYPGSFDPVTRGHLDIIQRTLVFCPFLVIGVGQNNRKKTLFSAEERVALLKGACEDVLGDEALNRLTIEAYTKPTVEEARKIGAKIIIKGLRGAADYAYEEKMGIVNRRLDNQIDTIFLFTDNSLRDVSSSTVKEMALAGISSEKFDHYLTPAVRDAVLERLKNGY